MLGGSSRAAGDAHHYGIAILTKPRPPSDSQDSKAPQPQPHVDVERFRADLREAGVEEMIGTLLDTFVEDAPVRLAALEQATKNQDAKAVETAAHAFKSGAGTIRATFLADFLATIETAGRTGRLETVSDLLETIRNEYLAVMRELEAATGR
jgi:HPt (histidine-containing phosphotransfer) domain-containing protein